MKTSIIIATYNGEKYIDDQLLSIYKQTQLPDEVIIYDDNSKDNTVGIANNFINRHGVDNWKVVVNKQNKGWQRNFTDALEEVSGDVIFFCDQDDIWIEDRIEVMVSTIKNNPEVKCLSGKIMTIDGDGKPFENKHGYDKGRETQLLNKVQFNEKFNTLTLLGCSMCLTREFARKLIATKVDTYSHDAQSCRLATLLDGMYIIDKVVIKYRIHNNNTSGVIHGVGFGSSNLEKRVRDISNNIVWLNSVINYYEQNREIPEEKINIIYQTKKMQEARYYFFVSRNIFKYLKLFKYRAYYSSLAMLIGDFTYCYRVNKFAGKTLWRLKRLMKISS